jgi:hypothetical protein
MPLPPRRPSPEDPAVEPVAQSLRAFSRTDEERLPESVKARHRADLLAQASPAVSSKPASEQRAKRPVFQAFFPQWSKRVAVYASGFAVLLLVLNLALTALPSRRSSVVLDRILVPVAQAEEAFTLTPVRRLPSGIDPQSGWKLTSTVLISREAVARAVRLDPPADIRVEQDGDGWKILPNEALQENTMYRVELVAALQQGEQEIPYEYSWVDQTTGVFAVESMSPGPRSAAVPTNAAIEVQFSHGSLRDPADFFTIQPAVAGRFERVDRTVIFLPDRPLVAGTVYRVTIKKGFGVEGDKQAQLAEEVSYTFQVGPGEERSRVNEPLWLPEQMSVRTDRGIDITVFGDARYQRPVSIDLFRVTPAQAEAFLRLRLNDFRSYTWHPTMNVQYEALLAGATPQASFADKRIEEVRGLYGSIEGRVSLPRQAPGLYLARVRPQGVSDGYVFVQVSDVAVHAITDQESVVVWAVDASTKQPLTGVTASMEGLQAQTNSEGIASLRRARAASSRDIGGTALEIVRVERGADTVMLPLRQEGFGFVSVSAQARSVWAGLFVDRTVQRQDDTLSAFGLAVDRQTNTAIRDARLELRPYRPMFWYGYGSDWSEGSLPVLQQQSVDPDTYGRFSSAFSWKGMKAGMYTLALMQGDQELASSIFSVSEAQKPAVHVTIEPKTAGVIAGQPIEAVVTVTFMDGTPYMNGEVEIESYGGRVNTYETVRQRVTLDANGKATVRLETDPVPPCITRDRAFEGSCMGTQVANLFARMATGEGGQSQAQTSAMVYPSEVSFSGVGTMIYPQMRLEGKTLRAEGSLRQIDVSKGEGEQTRPAPQGTRVVAELLRRYEDRIQTGTSYNEVTKTVEPIYSIQQRYVRESSVPVTVGTNGAFLVEAPVQDVSAPYVMVLSASDTRGRSTWISLYPAFDASANDAGPQEHELRMMVSGDEKDQAWSITMPFESSRELRVAFAGEQNLPADVSKPLFVLAARGIQGATVATDNRFTLQMSKTVYPSASVYAAVLTDEGFKTAERSFMVKQEDFALKVEASTDKPRYEPGQAMRVRARILDEKGRPMADTRVVVSVADKALEGLGAFSQGSFLQKLYGYVSDGVLAKASTHDRAHGMGPGGAEGGGGGSGELFARVRKEFRDQAAFLVLTTNEEGWVEGEVILPDNITTWRIDVLALSPERFVGEAMITAEAGKALAVDAVVPEVLLVGDETRIKLRAIYEQGAAETEFTYALRAPSLGITEQVVRRKGLDPVYLPLRVTKEQLGEHVVTVAVGVGSMTDAQEVRLRVTETEPTKRVWESREVAAGMTLPAQDEPFTDLVVTSRSRAAFLQELERIASEGKSSRLEARLAARWAQQVMMEAGIPAGRVPDIAWDVYRGEKGFRPLPYSQESLKTTIDALMSKGSEFEPVALRSFFEQVLRDKKSTREAKLQALLGLGLTGKPVLEEWRSTAQRTDLSWQEQAIILRGCIELGDRACARKLFDQWMQGAVERDGGIKVQQGDSEIFSYAQTRLAWYAAEYLLDERREALRVGVSRLPKGEGSYDPVLDMAIVARQLATAPVEEASVTYSIDGRVSTQSLLQGVAVLNLDRVSWERFRVESVQGPVVMEWRRLVPGALTSSEGLSLERTYEPLDGRTVIRPGDLVRITLKPSFTKRDTYGCYEIRDTLPAALRTDITGYGLDRGWYPTVLDSGVVSFIACSAYGDTVSYTARVVAPGVYGAYPAVMQHLEEPSLGAVSLPTKLTVQE